MTAIIFRLGNQRLYPASARGLLQVVGRVDSKYGSKPDYRPFPLDGLSNEARANLADLDITSWSWPRYSKYYAEFSQAAGRFQAGDSSAKALIGSIARDWNDLGYSRIVGLQNPQDESPEFRLKGPDGAWVPVKDFGARAFLIHNTRVATLPGRTIIEFDAPERQMIPDLWEMDPTTRQLALR